MGRRHVILYMCVCLVVFCFVFHYTFLLLILQFTHPLMTSSFTQLEYDEDDEEGDTNLNAQSVPDIRGEDEPPLDDDIESEPTFEISVVIRKGEVSVSFSFL